MKLLASCSPGEMRVAAWDGTLQDYAIWRPGAPDGVGDLHRGRVISRVPAMAGAFVAIAGAEGFLPDSEGATAEGNVLGVRVTRAAQGGKGPRLSAKLDEADQQLFATTPSATPALLRRGLDPLTRLARQHPQAPIVIDDAGMAARLGLHCRVLAHAFDDAVEDAVATICTPSATLPGGALIHVFPTPALTAIDVDLSPGHDRRGKQASQAHANRVLLPGLARQIRLRNLSGAILVDLAGMALRARAALGPDFIAALATDSLAPKFLGFSALGLAEILRPRIHPPLHELLAGPHAAGLQALRQLARTIASNPTHPPVLHVTHAIATALQADSDAMDAIAARAGQRLTLIPHHALPPPGWSLES